MIAASQAVEDSLDVLVLSRADVADLLSMEACIEAIQEAQIRFSRGEMVMPVRLRLAVDEQQASLLCMPAWMGTPPTLGTKLISSFPNNRARGLPAILGVMLLFDAESGCLRALLDAVHLTAVRTAAASAVATRALARADASTLALIGAGTQARSHLEAMLLVRPIEHVRVAGRTPTSTETFVAWAREAHPEVTFTSCDVPTALQGADIICTVTTSATPVTAPALIEPGSHLNAVGSHSPAAREIDGETMGAARVVVDSRDANLSECGDCLLPIEEGLFGPEHVSDEIGDVLAGRRPGRSDQAEITIYQSCGLAIQDVAAAALVHKEAVAEGRGTLVRL